MNTVKNERLGDSMKEIYRIKTAPLCHPSSVVQGEHYRFSILTPQLIRMEYSENGRFVDKSSQTVLNREFAVCEFQVLEKDDSLEIITDSVHLIYDRKPFSSNGLSVQMRGNVVNWGSVWHFGDDLSMKREMLGGTARTLDEVDGAIPLEGGLMSTAGFTILDDSKTLLLTEDGWVEPRNKNSIDIYFFGYSRNYLTCLKDFYRLCGETPLLPRYALGNWWSRYYEYTDESYKGLVLKFEEEKIPFSVAVIDMDWHLVNIDEKYGSGWTGYTWNKDLFTDPKEFMGWLHDKGMHITLNVHPAEGFRAYEDGYATIAKEMGVDIAQEEKVHFDAADPKFVEAYLKFHHPNEEMGVDFWWVDWQQGVSTKIEGLDPLWILNHYHFLDNKRNGKRPLILSRYAGPGSHRYPVGFSGDSIISWESLDFQPYFTANASNIGYGWWSHDIGGHMLGKKEDEMATRWFQYGVFSPIMRLHSSKNEFNSKEPWRYQPEAHNIMNSFLRLRHQLIPYLYTMNYIAHTEGMPLVQPMYYHNSDHWSAYQVPNEYYFGSELIVCPITKPIRKELGVAKVKGWLPKGQYIDFFDGTIYEGNRKLTFYRGLDRIPVLAKAGAIVPMTHIDEVTTNDVANPSKMEIKIFAGADGEFTLYEDDGETLGYEQNKYATTSMKLDWNKDTSFIIEGAKGDLSLIPAKREYQLEFIGIKDCNRIEVTSNDHSIHFNKKYDKKTNTLTLILESCHVEDKIRVILFNGNQMAENNVKEKVFEFLDRAQIAFDLKSDVYNIITSDDSNAYKLGNLQALEIDVEILGIITEMLLSK
jgi:alpha-glucosidase (family GH31 glycosyl hydrolase)